MGYEDRDYMQRERGGDESSIMPGYPACRFLIIATIVVFLAQMFLTRPLNRNDIRRMQERFQSAAQHYDDPAEMEADLDLDQFYPGQVSIAQDWFELDTNRVLKGQVWRLVTSAFVHHRFGVWHIFVNMLMLYWFGRELEDMYGSREFIVFYLSAAILASLFFVGLQLLLGERIPAIGASGAVMAVVCLYAIHYPYDEIYLMFLIPVQMRFLLLMYVVFDLHPILLKLAGTPIATGTAHAAHLGGLAFGYLYWKFDWRLSPFIDAIQSRFKKGEASADRQRKPLKDKTDFAPPRKTVSKKASPRSKRLEADLDSILQKISDSGEESLTDRERRILKQASDHFKSRR